MIQLFPMVPANAASGNMTVPNPRAATNASMPVVTVKVKGPVTVNAGWIISQVLSAISGFLGGILQDVGDKLAWFSLYIPTPSSIPVMSSIYNALLVPCLLMFALALIVEVILALAGHAQLNPADPVIALLAMLFGLDGYTLAAQLFSSLAYYVLNADLGGGSAAQVLAVLSAAISALPELNLVFFAAVIEYAVVGVFRILATATLACSIPLIALLWLVPPTRGLARDFFEGLVLLLLLSPMSSIFLALGMGSALNALHGGNPFLDFALATGTLVGSTILPAVIIRGGRGAIEAGRSAVRRRGTA
ncbi:hypothetical protein PQ610_02335 [Tardisphaera miroshnichenkoae]